MGSADVANQHVIIILSTFMDRLLLVTIDASDLLLSGLRVLDIIFLPISSHV